MYATVIKKINLIIPILAVCAHKKQLHKWRKIEAIKSFNSLSLLSDKMNKTIVKTN